MRNLTTAQVMLEFETCENTRKARNELVKHYKPHEIVAMTPQDWLLASWIYCDVRAGYNEKASIASICRQYKVSAKRIGRIFPEGWYDVDEDIVNFEVEYNVVGI